MNTKKLLLTLILTVISAQAFSLNWELSSPLAFSKAASEDKIVLVFFADRTDESREYENIISVCFQRNPYFHDTFIPLYMPELINRGDPNPEIDDFEIEEYPALKAYDSNHVEIDNQIHLDMDDTFQEFILQLQLEDIIESGY